ncbi:MAG: hypothetical protein AAB305_05215 [Candidatus Zixiibacteriota bacterium]
MNAVNFRKALHNCLWVLAMASLILGMAAFAESNPFGGNCGDDCTNTCDSSCSDSGTCLNCAPTIHLVSMQDFDHSPIDAKPISASWAVILPIEQSLSFDIDHPPQILS